jgi:CcmD family protein
VRVIRLVTIVLALLTAVPSVALDQQPQKPPPQDEFVPIDQLPPEEQLAAAPLLIAAYSVVWIGFVLYVLSLVKRIRKLENDLTSLERERR